MRHLDVERSSSAAGSGQEGDKARRLHACCTELLYSEQGRLVLSPSGTVLRTRQAYLYVHDPATQQLSVHFVKAGGQRDYLFHVFRFAPMAPALGASEGLIGGDAPEGAGGPELYEELHASGEHLCDKDMHYARYGFRVRVQRGSLLLHSFRVRYRVRGPGVDYTTDTQYERDPT